jgi:hypothetical protein
VQQFERDRDDEQRGDASHRRRHERRTDDQCGGE